MSDINAPCLVIKDRQEIVSRGGENEAVLQVLPYLGKRPDVKNLSKGKNLRSIMHRQRIFVYL